MNVPIPQWLIDAWVAFGDWANVWVWKYGRHEVLRIDILIVIVTLFVTGAYWAAYGWRGALQGAVACIVMTAFGLFCRRG